jgi:hypothetical protein
MLVATPIDGSHYFADVIAGIGLAALSLYVAQVTVDCVTAALPTREFRLRGGRIAA